MTRERTVARRYAKALLAVAPSGDREEIGQELDRFITTLQACQDLGEFLARPWIKGSDRRRVVTEVAERDGMLPLVRSFLGLLAEKNRIGILPEILALYRTLLDLEVGRVRAEVRTAYPLAAAERVRLTQLLARAVGKAVLLDEVADPGLLAGFRAQIGSLILDGSLRGRIESLRGQLTARS